MYRFRGNNKSAQEQQSLHAAASIISRRCEPTAKAVASYRFSGSSAERPRFSFFIRFSVITLFILVLNIELGSFDYFLSGETLEESFVTLEVPPQGGILRFYA